MMLWIRITQFLFGWHWVMINAGWATPYKRIRRMPNGIYYFKWVGDTHTIDFDKMRGEGGYNLTAITWNPEDSLAEKLDK